MASRLRRWAMLRATSAALVSTIRTFSGNTSGRSPGCGRLHEGGTLATSSTTASTSNPGRPDSACLKRNGFSPSACRNAPRSMLQTVDGTEALPCSRTLTGRMLVMPGMGLRSGEVFDVGDVPVLFRATDALRADALGGFLAGFAPADAAPEGSVSVRARRPAMPARRADHVVDGFRVWIAGTTMHVHLGTVARASATDSTAVVGVSGDSAARALPVALLFVLTHVLAYRDRFLLHAGAVVGHGHAYVVVGESGSGKSTLVAAALESGWQAVADDMVVVRVEDSGVAIAGIPRPI